VPDLTGRRFTAEVLRHQVDGLSIADVDDLTITAAIHRLREPAIRQALHHLDRVGLGYLRLIDLGPGPGRHGDQLLYQCRPANITGPPTAQALHDTTGRQFGQ
jgi:excinuclease UvrABC ATPase subunit